MSKILIEKSGIFTEISGGSQETPQQLLAKILTVDGKGSGLDADSLGGVNYSQYALKKDYYDRNIINTELSKKLNISDYNNEKSTFALKTELLNSNKPVYVVSDTEPTDKNVFWIKDEDSPAESIGKSIEDLKKYNDSNYNKIETLQNQIQELRKLLNKQGSSSSGSGSANTSSVLSQPRPNLLINGDFSFCRTARKNGELIDGFSNNTYWSDSSTSFDFDDRYFGIDGWNMTFDDWGSNNKIECSVSKNIDDESNNDIILVPKYLKIKNISIVKKEKIFLYQSLLHLNTIISQQKENNLDLVVSGIIKQKDLDFDYNIYLLYNYDYTSKRFTESEKVKLDKEYIDNTGKTPIKINYNVFENIKLKAYTSTSSFYHLVLAIEITPKDNTNKFSKTNSNNPILIGNLKLELVKKNEEKTPTLFSYYNNSYADDDIASSRYWVSFKGRYYSHLCSDNKHRITLFFNNDFYSRGGYTYKGSKLYSVENITRTSVTFKSDNPFDVTNFFIFTTTFCEYVYTYLKKANNWN